MKLVWSPGATRDQRGRLNSTYSYFFVKFLMGRSTSWLPFFWVHVGTGLSGSKDDIFGPRNPGSGWGLWGILVPKFGPKPGPQIVFQIGSGSGDPWGWWNMTAIGSRSLPTVLFQQGPLHPSSSFFSLFPPGFTLRLVIPPLPSAAPRI